MIKIFLGNAFNGCTRPEKKMFQLISRLSTNAILAGYPGWFKKAYQIENRAYVN